MDERTQRAVAYYEKHLLLVKQYAQKKRKEGRPADEPPRRPGRPALTPEERLIRRRASRLAYYYREKAKSSKVEEDVV